MGTAVIGGIAAASAIAIFIIPALFYAVERIGSAKPKEVSFPASPEASPSSAGDD
jgi:hypothetical protein